MTLQLGALRDALLDAGASPELASKAAEEAAGLETRFGATDKALADLSAQIDNRFAQVQSSFAAVDGRIETLQWMQGVVLASTGAIFIKLFSPH
jgi:phage shock protein A